VTYPDLAAAARAFEAAGLTTEENDMAKNDFPPAAPDACERICLDPVTGHGRRCDKPATHKTGTARRCAKCALLDDKTIGNWWVEWFKQVAA
jgi:hypothetical protein